MTRTSTAINAHNVTYEYTFQADIVTQMQAQGWKLGNASGYMAETALYEQNVLDFVQKTQPQEWEKFGLTFPIDSERHLIAALVKQLMKANEQLPIEHRVPRALWAYCVIG